MKFLYVITMLVVTYNGNAQKSKLDLAKDFSSADRKELLEALKLTLQPSLRLKPKMVVTHLLLKGEFAFFKGAAKDENGKEINFRKTAYKEAVEEGMFDGDGTVALLRKSGGKWKVLAFAIGPTDVPWGCWWKEFKAPKDIFDYTENCR